MKPGIRIVLHLLAPPFLGAAVGIVAASIWQLLNGGRLSTILQEVHDYPVTFLYAYVFGIVPSAVYAAIMEWAVWRGFEPGRRRAILFSGILGLLAGLAIILPFLIGDAKALPIALYLGGIGLVVGLLLEWLIGRLTPVHTP